MSEHKQYDNLVFVGRMQPFHYGHKAIIDKALEHAEQVVVVLGSCFQPRSTKNPFTFEERKAMIDAVYNDEVNYSGAQGRIKSPRVKVVPVMDYPYDDNAWVSAVQNVVNKNTRKGSKTGLIGHSKDHSSYYLKAFPDWRDHIEVNNVDGINATDIRIDLFENWMFKTTEEMIPSEVKDYIWYGLNTIGCYAKWFEDLSDEYEQIKEYREKSQMKGFNFPSVFVTTDAVITQSGYVLLVKRGGFPFKDCWALPGGYLDKGKFIVENMIKELREETKIKVPDKVLKGSIKSVEVFDHPDRDPRGRVITHGFHIDLGFPIEKLPRVKGSDDAIHAEWVKLSDVTSEMMAFDHFHIIRRFISSYE